MKKFICLVLLTCSFIMFNFQKTYSKHKDKIKNYSCEVFSIHEENEMIESQEQYDELSKLENFKKIYLKIIENLSFKNTLWEQSSNYIKIDDKDEIVNLWACGIRDKNGALLYSVSNENIKAQLKNIFRDNPSWFIEQPEYQIQSFEVKKPKKISKNLFSYEVIYKSIHSSGDNKNLKQILRIEKGKDYSKVCEFSNIIPEN